MTSLSIYSLLRKNGSLTEGKATFCLLKVGKMFLVGVHHKTMEIHYTRVVSNRSEVIKVISELNKVYLSC